MKRVKFDCPPRNFVIIIVNAYGFRLPLALVYPKT